jgi:hypothetical protein
MKIPPVSLWLVYDIGLILRYTKVITLVILEWGKTGAHLINNIFSKFWDTVLNPSQSLSFFEPRAHISGRQTQGLTRGSPPPPPYLLYKRGVSPRVKPGV